MPQTTILCVPLQSDAPNSSQCRALRTLAAPIARPSALPLSLVGGYAYDDSDTDRLLLAMARVCARCAPDPGRDGHGRPAPGPGRGQGMRAKRRNNAAPAYQPSSVPRTSVVGAGGLGVVGSLVGIWANGEQVSAPPFVPSQSRKRRDPNDGPS